MKWREYEVTKHFRGRIMSETTATQSGHEKTLYGLMAVGLFFLLAFHVSPFWKISYLFWYKGMLAMLGLVGFINAAQLLGYKKAGVYLALAACIGFSMEQIGIWTGWVFGPYTYTDKLGPKLIDVPYVIPFAWFAVIYFAHVIANLILRASPIARDKGMVESAIVALLTAFIATGLDMALDPAMSHPTINAWVWTEGGAYMGVPFKNFQGWVLTAFLIDFLFRVYSQRVSDAGIARSYSVRTIALFAIAGWMGLGLGFMVIGFPVQTQLIAVFTVMLPGALALANLYMRAWNPQAIERP